LSTQREEVQLLYGSDHFHSEYIRICVVLVQVKGKSWREAATACASSSRVVFALSSLSQTVLLRACRAIDLFVTFMSPAVQCLYTILIYALAFYTHVVCVG